ncbi:FAD/NAD(P)-binding domain-containing protein [Tothia fuscella]|uniref:FAD/NAD(P)-binding domain-containing protein n=1 Tax=Tothia fuscella TaxID=1048955 RepID=A0A9P4TTE5_9PEZI|nr:FAD/NAD(P)-binding domain-containing protein [Tothia fuscella]
MAQNQPHILIVGGAYAGLSTLNSLITLSSGAALPTGPVSPPPPPEPFVSARGLRNKPRYTLLDERDGFYHTVGAPLGQITPSYAKEFWLSYDDIVADTYANEDVKFVHGSASSLDLEKKIIEYKTADSTVGHISYDYMVVATGMRRGAPIVPLEFDKQSFLSTVDKMSAELTRTRKVVIVGGGAVGIELAAKVKMEYPNNEVILVHSRETLINAEPLPQEYKAKALELLLITGTHVKLSQRVLKEEQIQTVDGARIQVTLSGGETIICDKVIYSAVQKGANTEFLAQGGRDEIGCIQVRDTLQFPALAPNADFHFAAGDAVSWSGVKRSGGAQNMGRICAANIVTLLRAAEDGNSNPELEICPPFQPTMSLAIGEQAMGLRGGEIRFGKEVMERAFGRGLGIEGTLKKLRLTPVAELESRRTQEKSKGAGAGVVAAHI